jgi:ankyrin repeat protein
LTLNRFRWVALQLEAVSRCRSLSALRRALSSLPRSLHDTYRRILENIEEEEQAHVWRILQWLCFSKRPLRLEEIASIYQIADRIQPPFAYEDGLFHPNDIIGICKGLLSLSFLNTGWRHMWHHFPPRSNLTIVQLAHFSVKEYLFSSLSSPWTIAEDLSHVIILKSAIAYYLHFTAQRDIRSLSRKVLALKYSLAEYLVMYLQDHLPLVKEHTLLLPSLRLLLCPPATPTANKRGHLLLALWSGPDKLANELIARDPPTNLVLAIRYGLPQICQSILSMSPHINLASPSFPWFPWQYDHDGMTYVATYPPLVEAVQYGDREILRVLLDARAAHQYDGLDPLADGTVLEKAVKRCDLQLVQILLEAANDIRETASRFGRSLQLAIDHGYKDLIMALLAAGADPNARDDDNTAALILASRAGNEELVRILLGAGADVNISNGSAICRASLAGHDGVVRVLIEAGADMDMKGNGQMTAIEVASYHGHMKIIKMLLNAGAHVDGQDHLWYASYAGSEEIVRVLIESGADVNTKRDGTTILEAASRGGHAKIVKILLDAGADVNGEDGWALHSASSEGYEDVVRILIEAGAAVNLKLFGKTALTAALHRGHTKIVQILLDAGATPDRRRQ